MPVIKNAQIRYRIIDRALRNEYNPFPTKEDLRRLCEENLYGSDTGQHISDSTIEKDLRAMRDEHDAPIKYSKVGKGYCYDDQDYSLEDIPLSADDVDAIKFAANIFDQFKGAGVFKQFEYAIDKILDRVNISNDIEDAAVEKFVQFETPAKTDGAEFLQPLLACIKDKRAVEFKYKSFKANKDAKWKARKVHPYLLKEYRNRWYLVGFCENKEKVITYGLDRIKGLKETEDYFVVSENFNPDDYFKYAIGITTMDGQEPEKIQILADPVLTRYLDSQPLHASQKKKGDKKGGTVFSFELHPTPEFDMTILSYGSQVQVLKPKSYAKHIAEIAQNVSKLYE